MQYKNLVSLCVREEEEETSSILLLEPEDLKSQSATSIKKWLDMNSKWLHCL